MKTIINCMAVFICCFVSLNTLAAFDSDRKYADQKISEAERRVGQQIWEANQNQNERIRALEAKIEELSAKNSLIEKRMDEELGKVRWKSSVSIWTLLPIALVVVAILGFAIWPKRAMSASVALNSSSKLKCPRCGWEREPGDAVCRNPDCKTQF